MLKDKKITLIVLAIISMISIFFIYHNNSNNITLDEVRLKDVYAENSMFAIMVQQEGENYIPYKEETWPTDGYIFNEEKSGCLDSDGKKITNTKLDFIDGKVKLETNTTSYCYIYFDKKLLPAGDVLKDKVEDGLKQLSDNSDLKYRYVGNTEVNNYICFGTFQKTECTNNNGDNNYMYRIIGIDKSGRLKLIKNTHIGTHTWNSSNATWNSSSIFTYLNTDTNGFYENSSHKYMLEEWKSKIDENTWNIGDVDDEYYAGDVTSLASSVLTYEKKKTLEGTSTNKIGLIYLSDYYYAYNDGQGVTNCNSSNCTSWLTDTSNGVWTMTRNELDNSYYLVWFIPTTGSVGWAYLFYTYAVRPVFYLNSDVTISKGTGTLEDPFIIN